MSGFPNLVWSITASKLQPMTNVSVFWQHKSTLDFSSALRKARDNQKTQYITKKPLYSIFTQQELWNQPHFYSLSTARFNYVVYSLVGECLLTFMKNGHYWKLFRTLAGTSSFWDHLRFNTNLNPSYFIQLYFV